MFDAVTITNLFTDWTPIIVAVFTFVVTAASLLLKMAMTFVNKRKELDPDYKMGTLAVVVISLLTSLAQNSKSASNLTGK